MDLNIRGVVVFSCYSFNRFQLEGRERRKGKKGSNVACGHAT